MVIIDTYNQYHITAIHKLNLTFQELNDVEMINKTS